MKPLVLFLLCLALTTQTAWCDWDHFSHHGGGSPDVPVDPVFDAFMMTAVLVIAASVGLLLFGGPVLIIFTRRIRDTLWIIPAANLLLYLVSIFVRPYPGGLIERFRPPGLYYTLTEIALLLILSFIVAVIIAVIQWIVRGTGNLMKGRATVEGNSSGQSGN